MPKESSRSFGNSIDHLNDDHQFNLFSLASNNQILVNELLMYIFEYLDGKFVMRICGLVNRQFRYCAGKVPLREINLNDFGSWTKFSENRYSKQYRDLQVPSSCTFSIGVTQFEELKCQNLNKLTIGSNYFPYNALASCKVFKNLEELVISTSYNADDNSLEPIFKSNLMDNLKVLNVSGCSHLHLNHLFENSTITKLEKLIVDQTQVSMSTVTNWKYAPQLTYLSACDCPFKEDDFESLVSPNSKLYNLTFLNIQKSFKPISNMKEVLLSESLNFKKLKSLNLSFNMFSPYAITPRVKFDSMITLDMSSLRIGEKAFKSVIRNQSLKKLENLIVRDCRLGWEFIEALVNPTINCLKSLKTLNMNENKISSKGLVLLTNSKILSQLTIIEIDANFIGMEGASTFLDNYEKFKHLKRISMKNNNFGSKLAEFRKEQMSNTIVDEN